MNPIGGYFELELPDGKNLYHQAPSFSNGRSALLYILQQTRPKNVYIPFYTCGALLEPFTISNTPYQFYAINESFEPKDLPELKEGEYFLYINYFDLKRKTVEDLSIKFGSRLIVDCSQAFFMRGNGRSWFFNSCRKFFGVPDGAYLIPPDNIQINVNADRNENYIVQHLVKRLEGKIKEGYNYFQENEESSVCEIKKMSVISERLLSNVDFEHVKERRISNFDCLHDILKPINQLDLPREDDCVPMVYPLMLNQKVAHETLWAQNIFLPVFWPDISKRKTNVFQTEQKLSEYLLPLPVDHRYTKNDMIEMSKKIKP